MTLVVVRGKKRRRMPGGYWSFLAPVAARLARGLVHGVALSSELCYAELQRVSADCLGKNLLATNSTRNTFA